MIKLNKEVSPYLTVYVAQSNSIFSIMQRLTGLFLIIFLIFFYISINFGADYLTNYDYYSFLYLINKQLSWYIHSIIIFLALVFFYHFVAGLRYFYKDTFGVDKIDIIVNKEVWNSKFKGILLFVLVFFLLGITLI
jgi:succinate dehydrogenase/fumarate reductase cytochrome b subunit